MAKIEERLTRKSQGLKTIRELNKDYVKHLVDLDKGYSKHKRLLRKHKMKVRKNVYKRPSEAISLAQVKSKLQTQTQQTQDQQASQHVGHASIRAPKDKDKLKLVQINNQKPKHVVPKEEQPIDLLQFSLQGLSESAKRLDLDALDDAESDQRKPAQLKAEQSNLQIKKDEPNKTSPIQAQAAPITIEEGMKLTGGYKGTDLDNTQLRADIVAHMDQLQKERLAELRKQRRVTREKILCAENCQLMRWSYLTGIHLNQNCPIDCPENELNG